MVDSEEVLKTAETARIELDDEEVEKFSREFDDILEMFEKLEKVDTEDVEPAFHPVEVEPDTREDEKEDTLDHDKVFANTENEEDGYFKGPSA